MNNNETLKILAVGNSFSDDTMEYVGHIAKSLGISVSLGNLVIGGCSIETHENKLLSNEPAYEYRTFENGEWVSQSNYKIQDVIKSQNWDYVSFQQASHFSGIEQTYARLGELTQGVRALVNSSAKFIWHMTWAYQADSDHSGFANYSCDQMVMYNSIVSVVNRLIVNNEAFKKIVPVGTAIQNARTSVLGDKLTRDGFHLNLDYGRYIAGLTFLGAVSGVDISNVNFAPANVSSNIKAICIESAKNALKTPFAVTESSFK